MTNGALVMAVGLCIYLPYKPQGVQRPAVCALPTCTCRSSATYDVTALPPGVEVTCVVKVLSLSESAIELLSSEITSLRIVCSDFLAQSYLNRFVLENVPRLSLLEIDSCGFATVWNNSLRVTSSLTTLNVKNCRFADDMPRDLISGLRDLRSLSVTDCMLRSLPSLCGLWALRSLNVSGNKLTSLNGSLADCLGNVPSVVEQYREAVAPGPSNMSNTLDENSIPESTNPCLESIPSRENFMFNFNLLIALDISNNSFEQLPLLLLERAPNLQEIYARDNLLSNLSLGSVSLPCLKSLDVLGQELQNVDFLSLENVTFALSKMKLRGEGNVPFSTSRLRRFPNLSELHLENFAINDSVWEEVSVLNNLTHLSLIDNEITTINLSDVNVLLSHLNLSGNAIDGDLSVTFARHRTSLVSVDLSRNDLTRIHADVFVNMTSLQSLFLSSNRLGLIFQSGIRNLPDLEELRVDSNSLVSLPAFLLREMPALKVLKVGNNSLAALPLMNRSPRLTFVDASFNQITSLDMSGFRDLQQLEFLYVRGNALTSVKSSIFLEAPRLLVLDLRENRISTIESFGLHQTLSMVLLSDNKIQDVSLVFRYMPALRAVFMDKNFLERLTISMFSPSLQYLSVSANALTYIDSGLLLNFPRLIIADLSGNWLMTKLPWSTIQVEPSLSPKPTLIISPSTFDCDCEMSYLKAWSMFTRAGLKGPPELMDNLPVLTDIEGVDCQTYFSLHIWRLIDVPLWDFVCPYTEPDCDPSNCSCCIVHNGQVTFEPNCTCILSCPDVCICFFGGSPYVKLYTRIFCDDGRNLTGIPEDLPIQTTHLYLDGNNMSAISNTSLAHLEKLIVLYLNKSAVEIIEPRTFESLRDLELLDLSFNALTVLDKETFGSLPSLKELYLQHNHLEILHIHTFSGLPALQKVMLHSNRLKRMDSFQDFIPLSVSSLSIAGNPWTCTCHFVDSFLKFLLISKDVVVDYQSLSCVWDLPQNREVLETWIKLLSEKKDTVGRGEDISNEEARTQNASHWSEAGSGHASSNSSADTSASYEPVSANTGPETSPIVTTDGSERLAEPIPASRPEAVSNLTTILLSDFDYNVLCVARNAATVSTTAAASSFIIAVVVVVVGVATLIAVSVMVVRRRREVQALVYDVAGVRLWDGQSRRLDDPRLDDGHGQTDTEMAGHERAYDAFVSYSHQDEDFVVRTLVPRLEENGSRHYRLCVHYRDFPVGAVIADSIIASIENSKRTIILLSNNFVTSEWCRFEFRAAHQHVLKEGLQRLIIILLKDVNQLLLDADLQMVLKTRTYLSMQDPWFWKKLMFALPHVPKGPNRRVLHQDMPMQLGQRPPPAVLDDYQDPNIQKELREEDKEGDNSATPLSGIVVLPEPQSPALESAAAGTDQSHQESSVVIDEALDQSQEVGRETLPDNEVLCLKQHYLAQEKKDFEEQQMPKLQQQTLAAERGKESSVLDDDGETVRTDGNHWYT